MKINKTSLPEVFLIEPKVFHDERGFFLETWQADRYRQFNFPGPFVQANSAWSKHGVLRGLHYQLRCPQGKLVWVTYGEVFDVAADIRVGSPTFGQWIGEILSAENRRQLYIPPGFAHGYCVLSDSADFSYFCTDFYTPGDEYGVCWNDTMLKIAWPLTNPIVSEKDQKLHGVAEISETNLPLYQGG